MTSPTGESRGPGASEDPRRVDHLNADLPPEVYAPEQPRRPEPGSREEMMYLRRTSTWVNMVIALVACLLVVIFIVAIVPRTDQMFDRDIDVAEVALQAEGSVDFTLAQPDMGEGWSANEATLTDTGDPAVPTWYVSLIGPSDQWVTLRQARSESEAWVATHTGDAQEGSPVQVAGREWSTFMTSDDAPQRFLVTTVDGVTYIVSGQAAGGTLETAAERTLASVGA